MTAQKLVFTAPWQVELQSFDFDPERLGANDVALRSVATLISPGTDLACLSGTESWAPHPFSPGYAGTGEVLAVGANVKHVAPSDTVFAYTGHASHAVARGVITKLVAAADPRHAVFARMAAVSMTALRVAGPELGDTVAVLGLGLVGNFCAQLFTLAGCDVIGLDPSPRRRELATACGVALVVDPTGDGGLAAVKELTGGALCDTVVEATGLPPVVEHAPELAGKLSQVILLGSPRGEHETDLTAFLNRVHLWNHGCVTLKGAHEWRYPLLADPQGQVKHSIQRNVGILLDLIAAGRLQVDPLLTHVLPPTACAEAYAGLRSKKDEYLGVVFDWTTG